MNKRLISFVILAGCLLLLGWWFLWGTARHATPNAAPVPAASSMTTQPVVSNTETVSSSTFVTSKTVRIQTGLGLQEVRLFKSTNYPPQTAEEKAQWEWWDAMDKADPEFQWKMPIEFYGKVVDQFDQPVAGAEVELNWTTVIGPIPDPKKSIFTGSDGRFTVTGIQGKGITIAVYKEGYDRTHDWIQSFEYAAFYQDDFHVPDPNNPVLFHLHKLMGAELMYKFLPYGDISVGGAPLILNVEKGRVATQGDLAFSVVLGTETNQYGPDFTLTVQGLNGASCIFSDEEFLFKAPETGYQSTLSINAKIDDPKYSPFQKLQFYVKTGAGKFAAVEAKVNLWNNMAGASFSAIVYFNPSGSRNLEFDQNKWINR